MLVNADSPNADVGSSNSQPRRSRNHDSPTLSATPDLRRQLPRLLRTRIRTLATVRLLDKWE